MVNEIDVPKQSNKPLKLDEIDLVFEKEGNLTRFNVFLHIWGFLVCICIAWNLAITVFTGANPGWTCTQNKTNQFCNAKGNETFLIDHESYDERCALRKHDWTYITDKMYSFVTEFDLICNKKTLAALISSSYYIGGIIGAFFAGMIADFLGRKIVLSSTLLICFLASLSGYFIKDIWQLFICNIIVGGAQISCIFTLLAYVFELVAPKNRVISNSIIQTSMIISLLIIDMMSYLIRDWRKVKLYSSFPCLLPFLISFAIPESPRWLLSKGKEEKAKIILSKILNFNKSKQIIVSLKNPKRRMSMTHKELFQTPSTSALTLSIAFLRFVIFAAYYILLLDSPNLGGDMYQSFAIACIPDLVTSLTYQLYANRIGRRKAIFGSLLITGVLSLSMSFIPHAYPYKYYINMVLLVPALLFGNVAILSSNTWVFEIFPTCLRARGMSICIMADRFGILISPFVIRLLSGANHKVSYYIVFTLCILGVIIPYFILPETRNRKTRQNIEDFKGRMRCNGNENVRSFDNFAVDTVSIISSFHDIHIHDIILLTMEAKEDI